MLLNAKQRAGRACVWRCFARTCGRRSVGGVCQTAEFDETILWHGKSKSQLLERFLYCYPCVFTGGRTRAAIFDKRYMCMRSAPYRVSPVIRKDMRNYASSAKRGEFGSFAGKSAGFMGKFKGYFGGNSTRASLRVPGEQTDMGEECPFRALP
jgi:hypothetical protein